MPLQKNTSHPGSRYIQIPFKQLTTEELAEVYSYALEKYGRDHPRINLIRDQLTRIENDRRFDRSHW